LIAPLALMAAVAHILNKLGNDSELIVLNAAGMSPGRVFRPFLAATVCVSLLVAVLATYVAPDGLRRIRVWTSQVRTEFVANSLQAGRFLILDSNLTLHIRERQANGHLLGIMIDDQRDPNERSTVIAEGGDLLVNDRGAYLVLQKGTVQQQKASNNDPTIVRFDQHAFDLSRLASNNQGVRYTAQERYFWELRQLASDPRLPSKEANQFRAELHNRILAPLFPIAFLIVTFAYLGAPRTTRQGRALSMTTAIIVAMALRVTGFVGVVLAVNSPAALILPYAALFAAMLLGYWAISRGVIIEPPSFVGRAIDAMVEGFQRRTASVTGAAR